MMHTVGKLYGVGVGPGDPELITLKAKRIIETVPCIAVPAAGERGSAGKVPAGGKAPTEGKASNIALSIIAAYLTPAQETMELVFPMTGNRETLQQSWERAADQIARKLDAGRDVCLITLGDPTLYSTCMYVHRIIVQRGYQAEIIPGVTAMCAIAARAGISLAENDETLAIVPSPAGADWEALLRAHDNLVFMKASKNYEAIRKVLQEKGLASHTVAASRCGMPDEQITTAENFGERKPDYFTTLIIKKNGV